MNIRDVNRGISHPEQLRNGSVNAADQASAGRAAQRTSETPEAAADRVDISDSAREARQAERSEDLSFARKALLSIPPLSMDRIEDILLRIREGYYSQPEIVKQVSDTLADKLGNELDPFRVVTGDE